MQEAIGQPRIGGLHPDSCNADDLAWQAQAEAARCLSRHCSEMLGVDEAAAFDALTYVPGVP